MKISVQLFFLVFIFLTILVGGCASAPTTSTAVPPTPTPIKINEALGFSFVGHVSSNDAQFRKGESGFETRTPGAGNTFHIVTIEFIAANNQTPTLTLNLKDVIIVDANKDKWPAKGLAPRVDFHDPTKVYFWSVTDGSLDFGVGFTGLNGTMKMDFPGPTLSEFHDESPLLMTILFELPQASQVETFQFISSPAIELK